MYIIALLLFWLNDNLCLCELGKTEENEKICYHEKNDQFEGSEDVSIIVCIIVLLSISKCVTNKGM